MRIKVIITLAFVALLLSVVVVPVATASDRAPGTMERTTLVETSMATSSAWSLMLWDVERGSVTLSLDAAGNNEASSTITCMKPSDAATVRRAFMVTATIWNGGSISAGDITIDGNPITWDFVIPNVLSSYNYFTEVTALVKAKVDAAPAGPVSFTIVEVNKNSKIDGEILAVVFDDPAQAATNYVALLFGSQAQGGDSFTINLDRPICKADSDLVLDLSLGISYSYQIGSNQYSIIDVNGQRLSTAAGGEDDGASYNGGLITVGGLDDSNANPGDPYATPGYNPRYDDELYNLIPFVNDGDTSITISTSNPSNDDNLMFAALFLSNKVPLGEAVDYSVHPVTSGGNEEWFGQTNDSCYDGDAARSGNISHGQSTSLTTTFTGPGVAVFYWKISSERNGDFLGFYVDGKLAGRISGEVDWRQGRSPFLDASNHTLEWRYTKDRAVSIGQDCGWVDRLTRPTVVDYAAPNTDSGYLKLLSSLGITGVLRYLGGTHPNYFITADEMTALRNAGFAVGLIWQSRRNVIKRGYDAGKKDAEEAINKASSLGFPEHLPIYFVANDWEVTKSTDLTATVEYFKGIRAVFDSRPIGAYGQCSVITKLFDDPDTRIDYGWQAGANGWSLGCWCDDIQIRQTVEYTGVQYTANSGKKQKCRLDFDDIWTDDWGACEPTPVETFSVPLDTSAGITTSMTFETGKDYLIEATGCFRFSETDEGIRDAKYECKTPPFNCCDINHGYTTTWYGNLRIRDREIDWGECNSDHVYRVPYVGEGTKLNFYIYDDRYDDNSGSIVVNIFEYP